MSDEVKQYTLEELKAFYSQDKLPLVELYQKQFKDCVDAYLRQDGTFDLCQRSRYKTEKLISESFSIKFSKVCMFVFCFEDNVKLLNGKISTDSDDDMYFIESEDHIKIGRTRDIKTRLNTLQVDNASKLKLLFLKNGSGNYEKAIHRTFGYLRVKGEWFQKHKDLYEYIELLKMSPNPPNESWGHLKYGTTILMKDL